MKAMSYAAVIMIASHFSLRGEYSFESSWGFFWLIISSRQAKAIYSNSWKLGKHVCPSLFQGQNSALIGVCLDLVRTPTIMVLPTLQAPGGKPSFGFNQTPPNMGRTWLPLKDIIPFKLQTSPELWAYSISKHPFFYFHRNSALTVNGMIADTVQ